MRLYLAVAVLMLAFVAYTEAQEVTFEERFNQFGQQMSEFGQNLATKTKTALDDFHNSEGVQKAKSWLQEQVEKLKNKLQS